MPYIKQAGRPAFDPLVLQAADLITCDGDINYFITALIHEIALRRGINYQNLQNLSGCLGEAQAEFRRVVIGEYEKLKIKDNGFVSKLDQMLAEGKVPDPTKY